MDNNNYMQEFIYFRHKLVSYLYRLTTNLCDAEDLAQDTYLKIIDKFDTYEGRSSFKTWAFTIATNLARDNQRAKKRWGVDWMDKVSEAHIPLCQHRCPPGLAGKLNIEGTASRSPCVVTVKNSKSKWSVR